MIQLNNAALVTHYFPLPAFKKGSLYKISVKKSALVMTKSLKLFSKKELICGYFFCIMYFT
jgi:hypothetical protein